jgi:hypothetical protein
VREHLAEDVGFGSNLNAKFCDLCAVDGSLVSAIMLH